MKNWDRQYRLSAGQAGSAGFQIGEGARPLHISFSVERADTTSQNTAKVSIWNLNDAHLAELNKDDCAVSAYEIKAVKPPFYCSKHSVAAWRLQAFPVRRNVPGYSTDFPAENPPESSA